MKRLNIKLAAWLVVTGIVLVVGVHFLHGMQVKRTTALLKSEAQKAEESHDLEKAVRKYGDYLHYSGGDAETQNKFALLLAEIAEGPEATRRDLQNAFAALDEALRRDPNQDKIRRKLLDYSLAYLKFGEANEHAQILLRTSPNDAKLLTIRAKSEVGLGQEQKAADTLRSAIQKDPTAVEAYMLLALLLRHKLNDAAEADRIADNMVQTNPKDFNAFMQHARYVQALPKSEDPKVVAERTKARKADVQKALDLAPDNTDVILMAAQVSRDEKDFEKARIQLQTALAKHPTDKRLGQDLVTTSWIGGKRELAKEDLKAALTKNPDDPNLRTFKIELDLDEGADLAAVRKQIDELERIDGVTRSLVDYLRARALFAERKWLEASRDLERVRAEMPLQQKATIDLMLGRCHEMLGQPDRQIQVYDRALSENPGLLGAMVGKSAALVATGKLDDARTLLEGMLEGMGADEFIKNPVMRNNLINLLLEYNTRRAAKDRDWTKVLALLDAVQKAQPDALETALLKAEAYARMDKLADAKKVLESARDKNPKSVEVWLGLARLVDRQDGREAALKALDQAEQAVGDLAAVRIARLGLLAQADEKQAKDVLAALAQGADKFKPEEQERLYRALGANYYKLKNADQARQWWTKALSLNPGDLRLRLALFEIASQANDDAAVQAQIDDLRNLVRGDSPEVSYFQARRLVNKARADKNNQRKYLDEASRLLKRAADARPQWAVVPRAQAEVEDLQGQRDEAIAHLQRAVELGDADTTVLQRLAEWLQGRGRSADAERYIGLLVARDPEAEESISIVKADIARQKNDLPKAIELATKAVEKTPDDPRKLLYLGQLQLENGQVDAAEKSLRKAVEKAPDSPLARLALVKMFVDSGKSKEAREAMDQITGKMPEQEATLVLAQCYEMLKDGAQAEALLKKARDAKPDDLGLSRVLAMYYFRSNQIDKGREELEKLVAATPKADADKLHRDWAVREKARLMVGSDRAHDTSEIALKPLRDKKDKSVEDLVTMAAILAQRPDAASRQEAINILESMGKNLTVDGRYTLAILYERIGNWNKCNDQMLAMLSDDKQEKKPHHLAHFIELLLRHGNSQLAETMVKKLELMQPGEPLTIACRARVLVKTGKRDDGIALLRGLVPQPLPPQEVGRLVQVAKVMEDLELYEAAENMYREYIALVPKDILVLAEYFGRRSRLKDAMDVCEQALDTAAPEAIAQVSLTALRSQPKIVAAPEWQRIESWFNAGLAKKPDSLLLKLQKAEFFDLQGRQHEVESMYRDLLKDTNLKRDQKALVLNNLAFLLALKGETGESREFIQQAIDVLGPTSDLLDTQAMVWLSEGEPQKAIDLLKQALKDKPSGTKLFHLAQAYMKGNDASGAAESMRRALRDFDLKLSDLGPLEQPTYKRLIADLGLPN